MRNKFRPFVAFLLIGFLSVATVMCCCSARALAAHFHKAAICSHCPGGHGSHDNSSNPAGTCQHQFSNAEFSHSPTIASSTVSNISFHASVFFDKHTTTLPPSLSLVYPPGSPLLAASLIPLYLRTFNLRI